MVEKHSTETRKKLEELEETVETGVAEAEKMDKVSEQISSRREYEIQTFQRGIHENMQILDTAINELSVIRALINLRLLLTIVIFASFVLIYHMFLSSHIETVFRSFSETPWLSSMVIDTFFLMLSYFIVNHLALHHVRKSLDTKVRNWKKILRGSNTDKLRKIEESKSATFITRMRNLASNFMKLTASFVPIVKEVEEALEHQHLCYRIVDSIVACLKRYSIETSQHQNLETYLKGKLSITRTEEEIKLEYLQRLAKKLDYPLLALKLLYYDFSGDTELCRTTWQQIKSDKTAIEGLLRFLQRNEIISLERMKVADATKLVSFLDEFSTDRLRSGLKNQALILKQMEIVLDRAYKEGIAKKGVEFEPETAREMGIDLFVEDLTNKSIYQILSSVAGVAIDRNLEEKKDAIVKSLMVLSSASKMSWLREISNEIAGSDHNSIDILFVYNILKEERRGEAVTLRDASTVSTSYLREQKKKRFPQRDMFERLLKEGSWIDSIQYLNVIILNRMEKEIGEMTKEKEKLNAIKDISKNFLSQNTIMQVLESYTLMAYLVMAKTKAGMLMPRIDAIRDHAEKDIFWFKKYTNSARIGIVPPGMTFRQLCSAFERNLLARRGSKNIRSNIVIHRFTVSEFSSRQISIGETYEPPWVLLRDLIVENIPPEKLRIYLRYCELINESFWIKPFHEIIRDFLWDSMPNKFDSLMSMMKTKKILPSICSEFGKPDLRELVHHIVLSEEPETIKKKLNRTLLKLLAPLDTETISKISDAFYRRLHNFGVVEAVIRVPSK